MIEKEEGSLAGGSAEPEPSNAPPSAGLSDVRVLAGASGASGSESAKVGDRRGSAGVPPASERNSPEATKSEPMRWRTSLAHRFFTLAGFAFLLFEFVFLSLYFEHSWFGSDLSLYGIVTVVVLCGLAHVLLMSLETDLVCRVVSLIWRGKPPVCYRKWIAVNESGITYGIKHVRWDVIDELELSWFGNLIIRSRAICGMEEKRPDIVLKVPYGVGDQLHKNELIAMIKQRRPNALINARLQKSISSPIVKGQGMIQLVTSSLMLLVLVDVGFSSFYYLEMLKNYYMAGLTGMAAREEIYKVVVTEDGRAEENSLAQEVLKNTPETNLEAAQKYFERAEFMREHPFPLSWVSSKFLHASNVAAGVRQERSNVLWWLDRRAEAVQEARSALKEQPKNLRMELRLVRLLEESGKHEEAMKELEQTIKDHENSLLPRVYKLALRSERGSAEERQKAYNVLLHETYSNTFGTEPWWPPGGDRFYTELYYSRDLRFIMDRLIYRNEISHERLEPALHEYMKARELQKSGKLAEAESVYKRCLEIRQREQVKDIDLVAPMCGLADCYKKQKRNDEAITLYTKALALAEKCLVGSEKAPPGAKVNKMLLESTYCMALSDLAETYEAAGDLRKAEATFRRGRRYKIKHGSDAFFGLPWQKRLRMDYAKLLRKLGRETEAKEVELAG